MEPTYIECRTMTTTTIQSYLFDVDLWTAEEVRRYLRANHKRWAVDSKRNYHRARQIDPSAFAEGSFRTIELSPAKGIKAVVGHLR